MDAVTDTNVYEPHQWKHSTIVAGVEWKNPVGTASGTFQLAACRWFYDVSQMGAICTKGVSPEPWQGNPGPRTAETPAGMVNSVGLQNPGVDHYLVDELPKLKDLGATVITNVAGHSDDEYAEVVAKLADSRADMLEINVSCPNVNHGGMSVGTDPEALHRLIDRLRKITSKPMIVKLSPNVTDITTIARAAVDAGADALSLINTLVGMRIDIRTGEPILSNRTGGVSGPAIFPIALSYVCACVRRCPTFRSSASAASTRGRRHWNTCMRARTPSRSARLPCTIRRHHCAWPASSTTCWIQGPNLRRSSQRGRLGDNHQLRRVL